MAWAIEVTDEFAAWYEALNAADEDRVAAAVAELEAHGPVLGRPLVDTLRHTRLPNLKELRPRATTIRILFAFDPRRTAILLLGGDKAGQSAAWYRTMIPEAERLYEEYLAQLRREGVLD